MTRRPNRHRDVSRRGSRYHHHHDVIRPGCPTPLKLAFDTEEQAHQVLRYMSHDGRTVKPCRAYLCDCGYWHTASTPQGYTPKPRASSE